MTYLESDTISNGKKWGAFCIAIIVAASSLTWLDCSSPGTLKASLLGSPGPNQTSPPQLAFSFPLLMQAPSCHIVRRSDDEAFCLTCN